MVKSKKSKPALQDIFVSLVMVIDEDMAELPGYLSGIQKKLSKLYTNYEIVVVSNGLYQNESHNVTDILDSTPCVRIIRLSYKTHYDTALFAGLEVAIGDYVVTFNPVLDDIKSVEGIVELGKKNDIVQGVSNVPLKGIFGSQLGRKLFYWYNRKYVGVDIPLNATYFAVYSRRAINALTSLKRSVRHIRHMSRFIGFKLVNYEYTPAENPSRQRSLKTGAIEALEIVTSYSAHPLRFVTWLGVFAGVVNLLYGLYVVVLNLANVNVAEGWTTTSLQLSAMFFFLFLILVVLAEYIGRIMTESRKDPNYFVADELTSSVALADTDRRNISN